MNRFRLRWVFMFSILVLFTFYTVFTHLGGSKHHVYASAIEGSVESGENNYWVVLGDKALARGANHPNRSFWLKLDRFYQSEKICAVGRADLSLLEDKYGATRHKVLIKNSEIDIITIPDSGQAKRDIRDDLRLSESEIDKRCKIIKQNYLFYLLFDGHVS